MTLPAAAPKILVVDDDRLTLEVAGLVLRSAGYEVRTAQDAMQGTMLAQRERPALVLLDLQMPAGGGEQTLRRLQALAGTAQVPIVVCTASTQPGVAERMRRMGAVGFLPKPFTDEELLAAVETALAAAASRGGRG